MNNKEKDIIEVKGLTKYYGKFLAVNKINFRVKNGDIFGFLGPNGAGKTSTIKMLVGLLKPSSGTAIIDDFSQG
jgi:ABC-2 type transport system ATP-binding protein